LTTIIRDYGKSRSLRHNIIQSGDEIEELCMAFSTLAKELNHSYEVLDSKVKDATKNLHEMNEKLVEANKELEKTNRDKSDLIASISHELRTPLTSIKGAMDYIHKRIKITDNKKQWREDIEDFLTIIKKNAQRLINLVNDTIDLERIELGNMEMHISTVALEYLIDDVIKSMMPLIHKKHLVINVTTEKQMIVRGDEDRLQQVLINLLSNAISYSPDNDIIEIRSYRKTDVYRTEIADRGPGISQEQQESIFQRYYKKGNHEGSGLGLAICKAIVEAHNGIIGIEENKPKGSVFYFTLTACDGDNEEKDINC
jgi:signal transduction histidine kinase